MAGRMSLVSHIAADSEKAPRSYRGWHPRGSEVAGSEASARPPSCAHHSRYGMSRPVRMSKGFELVQRLHGFHVHTLGDTTNGCMSTDGPHFNPAGKEHGAPEDENCHTDDLENMTAGEDETVNFSIVDKQIPQSGPNSIIGRVVVVHANPDNLKKGKLYSSDIHVNFIFH
uniref:superoxide dismutase n=1 Tax=Elaeis guineensis var. tenera TaxID=51953 RepID=A0A6I9RPK3_ELAGV|nr:superoxide dismutase [Cu-Zn]-like [Elaeis guineensis]